MLSKHITMWGGEGLSIENKRKLIRMLEQHGRVYITTERNIDEEFKKYQLTVPPEKIHSLMYYATMMVGDSQTMTSEAAVLGTPAIKCNTFAGRLAIPNEIEEKYGLCYSFLPSQSEDFFAKTEDLLKMENVKEEWAKRKNRMLLDKIDVSSYFTEYIEQFDTKK